MGYGEVKNYLYEKLSGFLKPIQERYASITDDEIRQIMKEGTLKAREQATAKITLIKDRVGFTL